MPSRAAAARRRARVDWEASGALTRGSAAPRGPGAAPPWPLEIGEGQRLPRGAAAVGAEVVPGSAGPGVSWLSDSEDVGPGSEFRCAFPSEFQVEGYLAGNNLCAGWTQKSGGKSSSGINHHMHFFFLFAQSHSILRSDGCATHF